MGIGWASGINLYAAVFMLGIMGSQGYMELPSELAVVQDPLVLGAAGFMYCVEFFADKTPGIDSAWDTLHTFIRIPAGAMLAAGAVGDVAPAMYIAAGLVGGSMAMGSHLTKAGTRLLINTSPEPFTNIGLSIGEDIVVVSGLLAMIYHPIAFLVILAGFIALMIWALPKLWRLIKRLFLKVKSFFTREELKGLDYQPRDQ
jgi:hypothetical protein